MVRRMAGIDAGHMVAVSAEQVLSEVKMQRQKLPLCDSEPIDYFGLQLGQRRFQRVYIKAAVRVKRVNVN